MLKTSATQRSCAIASFHSTRQALDHLRGGDGQSVKCDGTAFDKEHIIVGGSDAIHMLCSIVSFKTARRRVVQNQFANRV